MFGYLELLYDYPRLVQVTCLEDAEVLYMTQAQVKEAFSY